MQDINQLTFAYRFSRLILEREECKTLMCGFVFLSCLVEINIQKVFNYKIKTTEKSHLNWISSRNNAPLEFWQQPLEVELQRTDSECFDRFVALEGTQEFGEDAQNVKSLVE